MVYLVNKYSCIANTPLSVIRPAINLQKSELRVLNFFLFEAKIY